MRHASSLTIGMLLTLLAGVVRADDPAAPGQKRTEGRFFVEAAEIMVHANDWDMLVGTVAPNAQSAATDEVATLSKWNLQQPKIKLGLNRPGKTSFEVDFHDFELSDGRLPSSPQFEDAGDQIVTTTLLPPGVIFQRQRSNAPDPPNTQFVPNWGEDFGWRRHGDYRSLELAVHRTFFENKHFRARWIAGLRYGQISEKISMFMAFAEEGTGASSYVRDFFFGQAMTATHGIGPEVGLALRTTTGKDNKWAFGGQATVTMIPESTNVRYALGMVDNSSERNCVDIDPLPGPDHVTLLCTPRVERPVMPGLGSDLPSGHSFSNAIVNQTDFTDETYMLEASGGFSYQITKSIAIGIEGWHLTWTNLLTDSGVIDQAQHEATYEQIVGNPSATDPQLRDDESIIHVPRFRERDDVSFDGVSLNLRFEF